MSSILNEEDLRPILDRLDELEKWKEAAQCKTCKGAGYLTDGFKEFECPCCEGYGLRVNGRICT